MEEEIQPTEKSKNLEGEARTTLEPLQTRLPSTQFVKVEKNLASLGFFTPSSKRARNEKSKTVTVTVVVEGKRIEAKATIAPTALFGLPITADQDKWLALHKIVADLQVRDGKVTNPISFSSAELLTLLKIYRDSGKNYKEVSDWLDVLVGTTIISEGAVYFAGKKTFGKDIYHVFDRAVSFGKQLPDGSIADKNYVWLSDWQLQNINNHHQFPIDLDTYRQLKNHISKALVPMLQVWLYATRNDGVFEKKYDELCQILNVRQWPYFSKIREKLGPSLDELKDFGYLADWRIERTSDKRGCKILFFHGEKFHSDRRARLARNGAAESAPVVPVVRTNVQRSAERPKVPPAIQPNFDPALVSEFTRRGITEKKAYELLTNLRPGQDIIARLEYYDHMIEHAGFRIVNPPGFYIRLIEGNLQIPDGFETKAQRKAREEREANERAERRRAEARQDLEDEYERYCFDQTDRYIADHPDIFDAIKAAKLAEEERFSAGTWIGRRDNIALAAAKWEIRKQVTLLTFDEFLEQKKQGTDFSLKPVAPSPSAELEAEPEIPEDLLAADERRQAASNAEVSPKAEESIVVAPEAAREARMSEPVVAESPELGSGEEQLGGGAEDQSDAPVEMGRDAAPLAEHQPEVSPQTLQPMMIELVCDPPQEEASGGEPVGEAA